MSNKKLITYAACKTKQELFSYHSHDEYEIIYVQEGEIEITINDNTYVVPPNHIILISNLEKHNLKITGQPYIRYIITINPRLFDNMISNIDLISMLKSRFFFSGHCLDIKNENFEHLFLKIIYEYENSDNWSDEICISYLKEILIKVYRMNKNLFPSFHCNIKKEIYEIQKYMEENYDKNIRISVLCEDFFFSKYYLTHCFKEYTGFSPKQYLTLVRLNKALYMLKYSSDSISDIALKCGFSDVNNFIRLFKEKYCATPSNYRKLEFQPTCSGQENS